MITLLATLVKLSMGDSNCDEIMKMRKLLVMCYLKAINRFTTVEEKRDTYTSITNAPNCTCRVCSFDIVVVRR